MHERQSPQATERVFSPDPETVDAKSGLVFGVAKTLPDVLRAWQLVYTAYRRIDLVDPNVHEIHTGLQAASPHAAVFTGQIHTEVRSTMTTIRDSELGLPLDIVFHAELNALRSSGRRLSEVGLFADKRDGVGRSVSALLNLMGLSFYYALHHETASIVIGVHPHHTGFYERLFAFERIGDTRDYATVKNKPVVLMHLPLREHSILHASAPGIANFNAHPIADEMFADRYKFPDDVLREPPLSAFRQAKTIDANDPPAPSQLVA